MASLLFDDSADSRQKDADELEIEADRRSLEDGLPWFLFLQQIQRSGLKVARKQFSSLGHFVGRGAHSEVYRYIIDSDDDRMETMNSFTLKFLDRGTVVALKRITPMTDNQESGVLRAAMNEIKVMTAPPLRDVEYLIKLHAVFWEDRGGTGGLWPTVVTEYCECTLLELLGARELPIKMKMEFWFGIGQGVDAIHSAGFVHGDIKCENILIQKPGNGALIPKVSDFGSSVKFDVLVDSMIQIAGTDPWRAPECVGENGKPRKIKAQWAPAADIFSFGLLLWVILRNGISPFRELYELEDEWIVSRQQQIDHRTWGQTATGQSPRRAYEVDLKRMARSVTNETIQGLKETNQVARLAQVDLEYLFANSEALREYCCNALRISLQPNPEQRLKMSEEFFKIQLKRFGIEIPPEESEVEPHQHSFQNRIVQLKVSQGLVFNFKDIVNGELKNSRLRCGRETRQKVFKEIGLLLQKWSQADSTLCPGCCEFSSLDGFADLHDEPTVETIFEMLATSDMATHSCLSTSTSALPFTLSNLLHFGSDVPSMALNFFICQVDGYGVDAEVEGETALVWLLKAAQSGSLMSQDFAPVLYFRKYGHLPTHVPSIKWLVQSVLLCGSQTARKILQVTHPKLLTAIDDARSMMMGTSLSLDEWQAGIEIGHWAPSQVEGVLAQLETHGNLKRQTNMWIKLRRMIYSTESVDFGPSLSFILERNDLFHVAVSSWSQPLGFCQKYIDRFPDALDEPNTLGETPLLLACRAGRLQLVAFLLEKGASVKIPAGKNGETPLHWLAVRDDCQDHIQMLLAMGADIDAITTDTRLYPGMFPGFNPLSPRASLLPGTPLDWAIQRCNMPMVRLLLREGANPVFQYKTHVSPIERAVMVRDVVSLRLCLDAAGKLPMDLSLFQAFFRDITVTQRLILEVSEHDEIRIIQAIMNSIPSMTSAADIADRIWIPLAIAIQSLPSNMIVCILDWMDEAVKRLAIPYEPRNTTVDRQRWQTFGYGLMHLAVARNAVPIIELLARRASELGYDEDKERRSIAFEVATGPDSPEILDILLQYNVPLDKRNQTGLLPIHAAIMYGNIKIAQRIVSQMTEDEFDSTLGRNSYIPLPSDLGGPDQTISFFSYALYHHGAWRTNMAGLKWLSTLPASATEFFNVIRTGNLQTTALHLVVEDVSFAHDSLAIFGQRPILEYILHQFKGPVHVNARNSNGLTPLHIAVHMGNYEYVEILLSAGADINAKSSFGTPLDMSFMPPPSHFGAIIGGPTQELVRRFVDGRNKIAVLLRERKALAMQEIGSTRTLGSWIPYPFGLKGSGPVFPYLMCVCTGRRLVRRYGIPVAVPAFSRLGYIAGPLRGPTTLTHTNIVNLLNTPTINNA